MVKCINKTCKNKSYVPKNMLQRNKIKEIICDSCAKKVQRKILGSMSKTEFESMVKKVNLKEVYARMK